MFISKEILSMEFRDHCIRVVIGKLNKKDLVIKKYFTIELPENIYENGEILEFHQLSYIIKRQLQINKIKTKNTHMLLDSDKIIVREIEIPTIKEKNYEKFLDYNLQDYLPIDKGEYIIKYLVIDPIFNEELTRIQVVAAPRKLVKEFYRLISHLELKPLVFDIVGNCISKFLSFSDEFGLVASIGIDYLHTNIIISNYGQLRYSKTLDIGYKKIINSFSDLDRYDLINLLREEENLSSDSYEIKRIIEANNKFQKELLHSIDLIFKYYLKDKIIERIYLYEDYSKIFNIEKIFSDHFQSQCHRLDVLDDLIFTGDILNFANSIGGIIRI